ncbi:hypothetical protein E2C01_070885 [Portunus trituberculatus]|uniref:Uncharacterized protein n=1 Tax=Portunus trituberculatus TaxID=210409 RepID=A0A5B7HYJ1_PORTR|nr:hypothetical protein [Portunus trituberculatus]
MDLEAVKVLLESQERTFRATLDLLMEQINSRIKATEDTVGELVKSLEFSHAEIHDLKNEVKMLRKEDSEKQATIDGLRVKVAESERRLNYQEDYSRRNNVRINRTDQLSPNTTAASPQDGDDSLVPGAASDTVEGATGADNLADTTVQRAVGEGATPKVSTGNKD